MTFAGRANLRAILGGLVGLGCAGAVYAADWTQYRGPSHDQRTTETIRTDWGQAKPKELWRVPLGESFGSFAVKGDRAYTLIRDGNNEACIALDARTGKQLWSRPLGKTKFEDLGGNGPRTTPTLDGDRVYVHGTYFRLACLNAADGAIIWDKDMAREYEAQNDTNGIVQWGNAMSPIVEGDLVIVAGGGGKGQTFMAFDKNTGSLVWKSGTEKVTHATATPATIHGVRQFIFFVHSGLVSVDPRTGRELWRQKFDWRTSTAASPVVGGKSGDVVYCAAAYEVGAGAYKITKSGDGKFASKELWRKKRNPNANHWSTPVHKDGYVYGLYGQNTRGTAPLECRDIETGEVKWSQGGFGTGGGLILAGDTLIVQKDMGPVTLVAPTPDGYKQLVEFPVFSIRNTREDKAWIMPVLADGKLYAKSNKEGVCLDLRAK